MATIEHDANLHAAKQVATVVYLLQGLFFLAYLTAVVGVVINYVKKDDVQDTWVASHFRWQIRTFWFGLLWYVVGIFTWLLIIGWVVFIVNTIWIIYRIVKGWLNLVDNKPMYAVPAQAV
jgi:uncharacterized membrane protein